ncbi:TldD/PmbA family protein [Fibrobacter sp. UWOV1]|uniref:TldD/PmbA family protein n=1 Tax=unclassified Fibrobacter TaxID=2634177 RepID=UPI0009107B7A|nr:TldD/PmbA family protein [Fibrobacter sp. UWOV1]SHK89400.1 microcin-processing peptidase 2. Unknown type peptidase. MEROPS family U62 [Fibrobacter sp. UWOV1]
MNTSVAVKIFEAGKSAGADFVEIYEEETRSSMLGLKSSQIESATAGTEYGIGIRLIYGTEVLYGFTSDDSEDALVKLVKTLAFGRIDKMGYTPVEFAPEKRVADYNVAAFKDPRVLGQAVKQDFLFRADQTARKISDKVVQVGASVTDSCSNITLMNSEGLNLSMNRARLRVNVTVTVSDGTERLTTHEAPGALGGYELLANYSPEALATDATERLLRMLSAGYIKGGQMPVVMGNGFGGVIFHEACGHPLETESVRRGASPFCGKLGEAIGQPCLTAIDDGTMEGVWGSLKFDDEGTPTQRTTLIENGILKTYMSDRVGAQEVGIARTGSARRESYKYAPVSRMRNTFIAPGKDTLDSMIASVDNGLYAARMAGGSVNPATGEFNFAVDEGYVIRGGKICEPVRGATLIGKGHEIMPRISMVGTDWEVAAGVCGASSGHVPVTVGQPSIKVDQILVGGR